MEVFTLFLAAFLTLSMFIWSKKKVATGVTKLADKEGTNDKDGGSRITSANNVEEKLDKALETPVAVVKREIGVLLRSLHEDDVDAPAETPLDILNAGDTVGDAKKKLGLQGRRLMFRDTPLDDAKTLEQSGVGEGATLYVTPADTVALQVRTITGKSLALRFNITDQVATLRNKVETVLGVEGRHQALILRGTELEDAKTLEESGVKDGDVVHVVMRFRGGEFSISCKRDCSFLLSESVSEDCQYDSIDTEEDGDQNHGRSGTNDPVVDNDKDKRQGDRDQDENEASSVKWGTVNKTEHLWSQCKLMLNLVDLSEESLYMVEVSLSWTVHELKDVITRTLQLDLNHDVRLSYRNCEMQDADQLLDLELNDHDLIVLHRSNARAISTHFKLH